MTAAIGFTVQEEKWEHRDVVRLTFDAPDRPVNVLTTEVMASLKKILDDLERQPPSAVILQSDKQDIFIAGADINVIAAIKSPAEAAALAEQGRNILWKLHTIRCPTFAAIDGVALGGGLELALFCDYRIVSDHPKTRLGLPEVNLGIIPGFGGTQTLPRIVGLTAALDMILTCRQVDGRRAEKMGLADRCVPRPIFSDQVFAFVSQHPKKSQWPRRPPPFALVREIVCAMAKREAMKKTQGNYPAPIQAIESVRRGLAKPLSEGLKIETELFSALPQTRPCKNLIRTYFQTEKFKKLTVPRLERVSTPPLPRSCAVIGAGTMGAGIAYHLAASGFQVRLKDIEPKFVQKGIGAVDRIVSGSLKKKRIRREEARDILGRVAPALDYAPLRGAGLVIEAVLEEMALKRKVFDELEKVVGEETILATNTSSLPVGKMAEGRASKGRFIGLHFFNPVEKMPLVEIVVASCTSDETLARALDFVKQIKKTPIVVRDKPGFLVNRLLMPYLNEAACLFAEGVRIDHIDRVALKFGMPMGPLHLLDVVGLDVSEKVAFVLKDAYGARMSPCPIFERLRKEGRLGQKNGKGFYIYSEKRHFPDESLYVGVPGPPLITDEEITDRLILTMVNEAARALEEQVVDSAETVDVGMLLGTGFPPFRGGLLNYADDRGPRAIADRLRSFSDKLGPRFAPADTLSDLARARKTFHPIS